MRRTMLQVIKSTMNGGAQDRLGGIEARLQAERMTAADALRELEQLEAQRRLADDYDAARALDDAVARARWTIERAEALIPSLEAERASALADHRREALAKHRAAIAKIYPRLRGAIEAAAAVQAEAIAGRQAAIAELGEGVVQANLPPLAFMGLLLPDLIAIWAAEFDRALAPEATVAPIPAPSRMPAATSGARTHKPNINAADRGRTGPVSLYEPPPPNTRVRRPLRRDSEAGEGERLVTFLRSDVEIGGFQTLAGDVLAVPIDSAQELVRSGAAEFAEATQAPPNGRSSQTGQFK